MYLVYLGLPRPETHTTGANPRAALTPSVAGLPGLTQVARGALAGARTGSSSSGTSSSLASAAGATLPARRKRSGLGLGLAAGGIAAYPPRHCAPSDVKLILVLLPQYTLYLCIWLCIWCVSASKTETHRYTRIRTPHPVYLTSRVMWHEQRVAGVRFDATLQQGKKCLGSAPRGTLLRSGLVHTGIQRAPGGVDKTGKREVERPC